MDQTVWKKELERYENHGIKAAVYLKNGIKLRGSIHDHDDVCLVLDGGMAAGMGSVQLIRYDAIATVTAIAD